MVRGLLGPCHFCGVAFVPCPSGPPHPPLREGHPARTSDRYRPPPRTEPSTQSDLAEHCRGCLSGSHTAPYFLIHGCWAAGNRRLCKFEGPRVPGKPGGRRPTPFALASSADRGRIGPKNDPPSRNQHPKEKGPCRASLGNLAELTSDYLHDGAPGKLIEIPGRISGRFSAGRPALPRLESTRNPARKNDLRPGCNGFI